jgi:hypothetical protein
MLIPTIATLRRSGYKVRVLHTRNYKKVLKICGIFEELSAKGGLTRIEITTPSGEDVWGEAVCSKEDNWDRKLGISIALGRALQKIVEK